MMNVNRACSRKAEQGFTLIELSIVLVIIGFIVGSVLVGRDLIRAAGIRAQITQIEKYNTAVNTFRSKYVELPGDMGAITATKFGFSARGQYAGEGDNNGAIEGIYNDGAGNNDGCYQGGGETGVFWRDLADAGMIEGKGSYLATANASPVATISGNSIKNYLPPAKIGQGNYIYIYSGYTDSGGNYQQDYSNRFGIAQISAINGGGGGLLETNGSGNIFGFTVNQAYTIDTKIDDGLPETGRVTTAYLYHCYAIWSLSASTYGQYTYTPDVGAEIQYPDSCSDNGNVAGPQKYSIALKNNTQNCNISIRLQ